MGVDDSGGSDTRTETTDNPTPQKQPSSPPPDNPGSPSQPSRLESLARAREQQEARAQDKDAGSSPREERDGKATAEQNGSGSEEAETSGTSEAEDGLREDDEKPGQQDKREQRPSPREEGTADARDPGGNAPGDRDRPQARTAEQRTEPADRPASSEKRWTPPPDNPGSPSQPSRLESLARAREQQEARALQSQDNDTASPPTEQHDNHPAPAQPEDDGMLAKPSGLGEDVGNQHDASDQLSRPEAAETRDESASEGPESQQDTEGLSAGPGNVEPTRETPRSGESGEGTTDAPGATNGPGARSGENGVESTSAGRPRAESIARAIEQQKAQAEQATAPESDVPRFQEETSGTGARPDDGGETDRPQVGDDQAGAETHENGEPAKADRSERPDAEPAHPDVPDRHPNPESPGATDDADPAADDRESAAADAGEPRPDTEAPDIADGAETGDPAPQERPDAGALTETDREGADQPAERTPDRADEQEATPPEGEAARDPYREGNDTERASEHEKPESTSEPEEGANETPDGFSADADARDEEPGDHRTAGNAPTSAGETDRDLETREPHDEQDRDRGRKSEDTDNAPPPNETNEADREDKTNPTLVDVRSDSRGRVSFEPRYRAEDAPGTELASERPNTAVAQNRPTGRDLDPIDPDRLRNDTGDPLETPKEQDLNKAGRDRWERAERAKTGFDAALKLADKAKDFLKQPPPTGQAEVRDSGGKGSVSDQPTNPTDAVSNGILLSLVVIGGTRQLYVKIKNSQR